jgi:peptidoglycan/xylan/chitin deacetylase (PgdA/CDA1 family)/glycosyltransferase involved in cell wall biosynthesis
MTQVAPVLSVVVFAYRNADTIEQVVGAVVGQRSEDPFEVLVASSGGDRTGEIVRDRFPEVRIKEWPTRLLPGGVRNLGLQMAHGEFIAFLEADMVPRPGWVSNRIKAHRAGHQAVAGAIHVDAADLATWRATAYLTFDERLLGWPSGPANLPRSYALSFTRQLLDRAGPFDETVRIEEDTLMVERLAELGVIPWFDASVSCDHIGPSTVKELLKEQRARGRRTARGDLLKWSPGNRLRTKWESNSQSAVPVVIGRALRHSYLRSRWMASNLKRGATDKRDLVSTAPLIVAGLVANQIGWAAEQIAFVRADTVGAPEDAVMVDTPSRSKVASNGERVVALAFDDLGINTDKALQILAEYDVPAVFFAFGEKVLSEQPFIGSIIESGHSLGTSGWSGRPLVGLDRSSIDAEIRRGSEVIEKLTGGKCRHLHQTSGEYDANLVSAAAANGMIMWHAAPGSADLSASRDPSQIADEVLRNLTPGDVVYFTCEESDSSKTLDALRLIIEGVVERRFRLVSLDYVDRPTGQKERSISSLFGEIA